MAEMNYEVELLDSSTFKIFKGVYNDFKAKAISEYKFELEPLNYEEFIDAVEKNYLKCIVLKENLIPTAFLVYTTSISEGFTTPPFGSNVNICVPAVHLAVNVTLPLGVKFLKYFDASFICCSANTSVGAMNAPWYPAK